MVQAPTFIDASSFLQIWQGNRNLTRKVIEAFPEKELFEFSIGGMRPFADMCKELLAIAAPGLKEIISGDIKALQESMPYINTKAALLAAWDEATPLINEYFQQIPAADYLKPHNLFGQFEFPIMHNLIYFLENEIHHRGEGYVYLRAIGIQPPFFWER